MSWVLVVIGALVWFRRNEDKPFLYGMALGTLVVLAVGILEALGGGH